MTDKEAKRLRAMSQAMSVHLYSIGTVPQSLNDIWLAWVERGQIPSKDEMAVALAYRSSESA